MSWKPKSYWRNPTEKEGEQAKGIQIHNICRNHILLVKLQAELFPHICWHPQPRTCSWAKMTLGANWCSQPLLPAHQALTRPWTRQTSGSVPSSQLHSSVLTSRHPTPSPQGFTRRHQGTAGFPSCSQRCKMCLPGAASQEAVRLESAKLKGCRYHQSCSPCSKADFTKVQCLMRGSIQKWSKRVAP